MEPYSPELPRATLFINVEGKYKSKESRNPDQDPGDFIKEVPGGAVLCDGAGGEGAGHDYLAAKDIGGTIWNELMARLARDPSVPIQNGNVELVKKSIIAAYREASRHLHAEEEAGRINRGADATANVAIICRTPQGRFLITANCGDAPTYIRDRVTGDLITVSEEHSLVNRLVKLGQITESEKVNHPQRNVVYRFVGTLKPQDTDQQIEQQIALRVTPLTQAQDVVMFSDGVTDQFEPAHLLDLSRRAAVSGETSPQFVNKAFYTAQNIIAKGLSPLAKPDDLSGVSVTTEFK